MSAVHLAKLQNWYLGGAVSNVCDGRCAAGLQVEKLKAWQAAQEREASVRPEAKRWIDPAIVER